MTERDKEFFSYCCRDSAVTYEINQVLEPLTHGTSKEHYRFNISLLNSLLYMEHRGIKYNITEAASRREVVRKEMFEEQARLNGLTGRFVKSKDDIFDRARETLAYKKAFIERHDYGAIAVNAYKDSIKDAARLYQVMHSPPSLAAIGEIEDLVGVSLNTGSPKAMKEFLFEELGLPEQYNFRRKSKDEDAEVPLTADYEALLKLSKHCIKEDNKTHLRILTHCINIRSLATRQRMLSIGADDDGRIRCGYNIVGSDTGRITCYESPTGSGYNLQTIPKYDRDLFMADDGCFMFQCDLSGADSVTVAAYSKMLGDPTMMDDFDHGLKPAKLMVLMLRGTSINFKDREALKEACKDIDPDSWDYFACKRVVHGASYCEGDQKISDSIFTDSEGKFYLDRKDCKKLRDDCFFTRYRGVKMWQNWLNQKIRERPTIIAASGQVRHFFGRKEELLPKACAFEPQAVTTYATNLALYRLWTDEENREGKRLKIEPLHQVHDALIGQFRKENAVWAVSKIKSWFNNVINIAGQRVVIGFDGAYGESWGNLKEGKI